MVLEELWSRIQWLEQQLREAITGRRSAEQERDDYGRAVDMFRKLLRDKEDEMASAYQRMLTESNTIKGTKFKRVYQARVKEIMFGPNASMGLEKLSEGASGARSGHQRAEETVSSLSRRIREIEEELSYSRTQMLQQQQEENANAGQ